LKYRTPFMKTNIYNITINSIWVNERKKYLE
jgi:hypothetical protein